MAWLFGDGKDFISYLLRSQTDIVKVSDDQTGSPTPIYAAVERLLALAKHMNSGAAMPPILHLAGSPPVSRADWVATAFDALRHAGKRTPALMRVSMADLASSSIRPAFSALDCSLAAGLFGSELDWRIVTKRPETFAGPAVISP